MRILLVEADTNLATQLAALLDCQGFAVDRAESSAQAIERVAEAIPDAIVADVALPGMDGFELCARIKRTARTTGTPVMLLGTRGDGRNALRALAAGADDFATCPYDDAQLLARLTRLLAVRSATDDGPVALMYAGERFSLPLRPRAWLDVLVSALEDGARAEAAVREHDATLDLKRESAEHANRAKDDFLGIVSHELRTPLTSVLGWAHLLLNGSIPEADRPAAIARLVRSARAQAHIIDDLLDTSRIVHGGFRIVRAPTDVYETLTAATTAMEPMAAVRGVTLTFTHDDGPFIFDADARRLEQVFRNLLHNAVKFTPSGGAVHISLRRTPDAALEVQVRDTGRGISPAFLPHLFERYQREFVDDDRARPGLGLGLAIMRNLVEAHRGSIVAESDGPGRGATFTVTLPASLECRDGATGTVLIGTELAGTTVLLVEPDASAREALKRVLEAEGAAVMAAETPDGALGAAHDGAIDVVLSDLAEEGGHAARFLSALRSAGCGAPAVALGASSRPAERDQATASGFADYLARPVEAHDVVNALARLAGGHRAGTVRPRT